MQRSHRPVLAGSPAQPHLEPLEARTLFSVVAVNASNWISAISHSRPGDTIQFTQGAYAVAGTMDDPITLPTDRTYIGNGATLSGVGENAIELDNGNHTEFTGFTLDGVRVQSVSAGGLNLHDNTFENLTADAIFIAGNNNSQINHNTFEHLAQAAIYGYPGDNDTYSYNRMSEVVEGIHLAASESVNTDVSYNVITGLARHGIELQFHCNGLTVTHNWVGQWQASASTGGGIAYSIATGPDPSAPFANAGENISVSNNVADGRVDFNGAAIESMGDFNINSNNNYLIGFYDSGEAFLNGTGGQRGQGLYTSGNFLVVSRAYADGDGGPWITPPRHSNDYLFRPGSTSAPPVPDMPTFAGANVTTGTVTDGAQGTHLAGVTPAALTPTIKAKLPAAIVRGHKPAIKETLSLINLSGAAYNASASVRLYLAAGTDIDGSVIELPVAPSKVFRLKVAQRASLVLSLKSLPSNVPDGAYHLITQITDKDDHTSLVASSGTINVVTPVQG